MSKRSSFQRRKHDAYDTPESAVRPLLPHLGDRCDYVEPCAGSGRLRDYLSRAGHRCVDAFDIHPRGDRIRVKCAMSAERSLEQGEYIITNPPWTRSLLHPMIERFASARPTWLLFDADWMHTKQAAPYLDLCRKIVSVGRVSWMENGTSGKDNCAWYLFDAAGDGAPIFHGRETPNA